MEIGHIPERTGRENRTIIFCPGCDWEITWMVASASCCAPLRYVTYESGVEDDAAVEHINNERRAFQNKLRRGRQATDA